MLNTETSCSVIDRDSLKVLIFLEPLSPTHLCLEEPILLKNSSLQRQVRETMTGYTHFLASWSSDDRHTVSPFKLLPS